MKLNTYSVEAKARPKIIQFSVKQDWPKFTVLHSLFLIFSVAEGLDG